MKRVCCITVLALLVLPCLCLAGKYSFPFIGRWQPSDDPVVLDEYGYQDIQNLRRKGKQLEPVRGDSNINSTQWSSSYATPSSVHQFIKSGEDHLLVQVTDGAGNSTLIDNNATVPGTGDFRASAIFTDSSNAEVARMSDGPQETLLYANGVDNVQVWGGDYAEPLIVLVGSFSSTPQSPKDVTGEAVDLSDDSDSRVVWGQTYPNTTSLYIGSPYRLDGVYFYVYTANTNPSTLSAYAYQGGGTWASISVTDGTKPGTITMAQSGAVTWTEDADDTVSYVGGYALYWYRFFLGSGSDAVLSGIRVMYNMQDVPNIWDGTTVPVAAFKIYDYTGGVISDYTAYAQSNDQTTDIDVSSLATDDTIIVGFAVPVRGVIIYMVGGSENSTAGVGDVKYWGLNEWTSVTNLTGTIPASTTLAKTGVSVWDDIPRGSEFPISFGTNDDTPLYSYRITHAAAYDADTKIYYVEGIPVQYPISGYKLPVRFSNRMFLFNDINGDANEVLYSAFNTSYIYNGSDSGTLHFGDSSAVVAAASIYNVFQSTGYEQLIVAKKNEIYRLLGFSPSTWETFKMSDNVGCVAPLSMVACDVADVGDGRQRQVAIWQSGSGVVMCDGATIRSISDDILCYWDANDSRYIPVDRQDDSVGWYDPDLHAYKLLISSGSGQATHNVELEYSLINNDWTKVYREDSGGARPLVAAASVRDPNGKAYSYGASVDDRRLFRLENGTTWADGTVIDKYVRTGDMLLDKELPFFNNTRIDWIRVMFEDQSSGTATFSHWCDGVAEVDGTNDQYVPDAIDLTGGPVYTNDCTLGPCLRHSIKIQSDYELNLTGMGLVFESDDTISQ